MSAASDDFLGELPFGASQEPAEEQDKLSLKLNQIELEEAAEPDVPESEELSKKKPGRKSKSSMAAIEPVAVQKFTAPSNPPPVIEQPLPPLPITRDAKQPKHAVQSVSNNRNNFLRKLRSTR